MCILCLAILRLQRLGQFLKSRFFSHFCVVYYVSVCSVLCVVCVVCVLVCSVLCVCHVGNVEAVSGRGGCGSGSLQPGHTSGQHHIRPVTSRQPAASPEGRPSPAQPSQRQVTVTLPLLIGLAECQT